MSWKEFKKKKEQEEANSTNTSINSSQMSSWQKFKQKKETYNNSGTTKSSWQEFKDKEEGITSKLYQNEEEKEDTWFKGSKLFDDGYQFGDVTRTTLSTVGDVGGNLIKGTGSLVEGAVNLGMYGVADVVGVFGNETTANEIRNAAKVSAMDKIFDPLENAVDKNSVLGNKTDNIVEGLGYIAGITAVGALTGGAGAALGTSTTTAATVGTTATTFVSAMGNNMTEALNDGATLEEARIYGAIAGAAEAGSELLFGGLGKASQAMGLSKGALDDVIIGGLTKNIKNKLTKTVVQTGLKAGGEGFEEIVSGFINGLAKRKIYMQEELGDNFFDTASKIWKDEKLGEQFFMGALTSAIAQGPSTIRNIRSGTDVITGRTDNEQKVYDNEIKTRTNNKIKQETIEQAYNEQIKAQENLGIKITEDLKAELMQKVEKAYDNGTLKTTELSKKDIMKIQDEVETDMQDGNISLENIRNVLGENQDISKDKLLMRSMYENKQKYNSYKVEQTDNDKVNVLMQSAADAGMNNTSKTRKKVELISKLIKDTDRQYKFVSPEQLKQMGYNENAKGLINKSTGEILINAQTQSVFESIVGHETTHIFDSKNKDGQYSKEYQMLQDIAIEYAKTKGIYDSKIQEITSAYGDLLVEEAQIKEELTADLVGDFLFNDEKFIENLAVKDRNVFQKIYDYIKHIYKVVTSGTDEAKALENLKYQFDKVYKTVAEETNTDTKYSIGGKEGIKNAIKKDTGYLKLERDYNKAQQMQKTGIDNETIRKSTGWFQDKNRDWKFEFSDKDMALKENIKLKKNTTYKLGEILEHDTLFTIYPSLKKYEVKFEKLNTANGVFNIYDKDIKINNNQLSKRNYKANIESALIHEIQHAIQDIENFEGGKSSKGSKLAYYESLGEIEAADTKSRFIQEKYKNIDLTSVAPETSKANPKHPKLDNYLKNRKLLDKAKDAVYNYIKKRIGDSNGISEENIQKNKKQTVGLVDGRKRGGYVNENFESNEEKMDQNSRQISNMVVGRKRIETPQESENNSGSFYLDKNIKSKLTNSTEITGSGIAVKDMLVQQRPTIENEVGNTKKTILEENVTKNEQENVKAPKSSFKELQDKYKLMEIGKRQYEKLLRKEKPTEKEKITVDRLIKGEIENNEIPASVNRQRVVDLYNAKVKFYSVEQEIKAQRKAITKSYRDLAKYMIKNISTWKDKKMGIQYQINTMKRNLRDIIPDKREADSLYNEYFKPITKNNATIEKEISKYNDRISKYEINNVESQYIQMIGENKYNPDTKLPLEKIEEFYDKNKSKIDINKCQEAVEEFRNIYDELIVKINDVLIENGYKPIEYRKGYFPHFVEAKANTILGKFAEKLGWKINADTLPTDIAGITDQFKPGKAWTAFSQQRKGDETDYNALKGFDNYIRGAMDVIHHTKDIQKLRALENEIRYQYSEKGIQEQIDNVYDDHESSIEEKQEKINEIFENNKNNPMGNLATELRDYTNNLANKKSTADRGLEHSAGRQTYSIMTNIQNRVSANMVGANISSAMTNFIPITQAWSQTSTKNMMRAIKEGIAIQFKDDGFSNESTFLTNRTKQADRLYKTGLDRANDKLGYMFDVVDSFTSNVIVRAKYYDNIDVGMSTYEALDNADEFAKDVIAGRSKGDMPTIFNQKNPLTKLFTAFQLEVNNQYGYMLKDMPADFGDEAKEKLVGAFVKMFLGAFLYNMISEKITGNKSTFSPIDIALDSYNTLSNDDMSTGDKIKTIGTDLVGETPFLGGIAGGGRLPIQGAIPYDDPFSMVLETVSTASNVFDGNEEQKQTAIKSLTKEWSKPLYYVALPFAGGQLKKTIEGASMYLNDVPGSYTNSGDLRFTVDDDIGSKVKATIFGTYANPYAQDYIDSGFKTISKDNIDEMVGLDMNSSEYRDYKKGLSKSNKTEEKLNYINSLDLTDSQKTLAANNINKNSKKTIDMSEYGNYSSYDEYKYARDNPEKYSVVTQITDYDNYVKYKDDIADIKKKYSTEAGYDSNERKSAVQSYINSLELNQYQKMMLEKMAGGYSIKNYQNYIYEYLETTKLTSSEKYAIWEELFN